MDIDFQYNIDVGLLTFHFLTYWNFVAVKTVSLTAVWLQMQKKIEPLEDAVKCFFQQYSSCPDSC